MNKLTRIDIYKLLAQPLAKKVDQKVVETWSATLWALARQTPNNNEPNTREPFVMMFPPPNITGNLHLGHALTGAVQDALIRQRRMKGYNCLFIPGFDHAGLATQTIVERFLLKQRGISRQELGRQEFVRLANDWKERKLADMKSQLGRLGLDLDYDKEYFTMDDRSSLAVSAAFTKLFNLGLIYRANKPIFWCESLQTTLSDIEVEQVGGQHRYIRTGEIVDRRPLSQWFIDTQAMARRAVDVVNNNSIEMIPPNYKQSWSSWLLGNGIQDWCISRQSWWGHRIPAYKVKSAVDVTENWIVADDPEHAHSKLGVNEDIEQDADVLDTWFSSSLLPLTVSGWPASDNFKSSCRNNQFPLQVMETGFDILTYWVSKMVMISLALTDQVPFKLVLLHGMICDSDGKKMSKSLGNVIDPMDVIDGASLNQLQARTKEAHSLGILDDKQLKPVLDKQKRMFPNGIPVCGADGLRAYLLSHDIQEEVVRVQVAQVEKVRKLTNKIWNMFRLLFNILERTATTSGTDMTLHMDIRLLGALELDLDDQQVLREMSKCVVSAHECFDKTYQLQHCFTQLEIFMTEHLSQCYMERIKNIITSNEASEDIRTRKFEVLATCLMTSVKLLHPYMPHISEFLFQKLVLHHRSSSAILEADETKVRLLSHEPFPKCDEWSTFAVESPLPAN